MIVYHGSLFQIEHPDLSLGRSNLDFGRGFYVTILQAQAERWALRRVRTQLFVEREASAIATVSKYNFTSNGLNALSFDGYTEEWLDFVIANRSGVMSSEMQTEKYDVVFGNIANDDVAREIDDYIELVRKNRAGATAKRALLEQLQYSKENNQYCLASDKSLSQLEFIESYEVV